MNVADSERIMGVLEGELGLRSLDSSLDESGNNGMDPSLVTEPKSSNAKLNYKTNTPDIILLNTCTIRDHAEQKVYDALGPYTSLKRSGHPLAIVVAGCVAQQEGEKLLRRFPEVDLVLGPQYIPWLGELLVEVGKGSQLCMTESMIWSEKVNRDSSREKDGEWMIPIKRGHSTRAWVNVIYGCNEHCTYCVVPSVRGVEQSRSMDAILKECRQLAESGYKEITLLGQNIDAYGRDMSPRRTFADLLQYLNDNLPPGLSRIRYVTSHPRYFSERVIDAVANLDKICECFHVPFQAGDDQVLRDMRRGYTYDSYMNIIRKIRKKAPDASICGDVIVGFPGESEEQFQRTLDLMEEVKFDNLNTFAYSPRPNTEAADWENQIQPDVQSDRLQRVQSLAAEHALQRSQRYLGREEEVLVEDRNPKNGDEVMGRTRQGRQVFFPGDINELKGELVMVEILEARTWSLVGRMCRR
jgi:tRNA-2-methylthio-N6-dimethylallyladenosine synthase